MRASNIALTFVAALASAFAGGAAGGFAAGLTHNAVFVPVLLLPASLATASLLGRWIARRRDAPSSAELTLGCLAYLAVGALTAFGLRGSAGLVGFVVSLGIIWTLRRAARTTPVAVAQPAG